MALDTGFGLSRLPASAEPPGSLHDHLPGIAEEFKKYEDRVWAFELRPDYCKLIDGTRLFVSSAPGERGAWERLWKLFEGRWLVLDHCSLTSLDEALREIQSHGGNGYTRLLEAGAVVVPAGGQLSGGSYARVQLHWTDNRLVVHKYISEPKLMLEIDARSRLIVDDAGRRLAEEGEWLSTLPESARSLFPRFVEKIKEQDNEQAVGYVTEFLPGYTLAEQLLDGRLKDPEAEARGALEVLLSALMDKVYGAPIPAPATPAIDVAYLNKIIRRTAIINAMATDAGRKVQRLMSAEKILINGTECYGLPRILRELNGGIPNRYMRNGASERAHGDLILDDMVVTPKRGVSPVDPSGSANSRLYDLGKLCLSLTTCYEFFKYHRFKCEIELDREPPRIDIITKDDPALRVIMKLSEHLPAMISECGFLDAGNHHITGVGLTLLNGLQNLALPAFHLLRGDEELAMAFLAVGLLQTTKGIKIMNDGRDIRLDEACSCIFSNGTDPASFLSGPTAGSDFHISARPGGAR